MKQLLLPIVTLLAFCSNGQETSSRLLVDKIVAVVGDKIVLRSDVENRTADVKRNEGTTANDKDCYFLQEIMMRKALVLQAQKDSLYISDEEIEAELEQRVRYFIRLYGSREVLEQIAGKTIYQIKEDNRQIIKEQKLAEAQQRSITEHITVTPDEVKKYYYNIPKDSLHFYEAGFELGQIVLYARPEPEMEKYAKDDLESLRRRIEKGEITFESVARLYSDDADTKLNGGLWECNRNDKTITKELLQTIFSLKEGQLSGIVKSGYGYHLIQLISRNGDDATVRHILKKPPITTEALNKTVVLSDTIRFKLISGVLSFAEAVDRYSEDPAGRFTAGAITDPRGNPQVTIAQLEKNIVAEIDKLKVGDYAAPVLFTDDEGRKGARVLYLKRKTAPHVENLKDDYERIAQRLMIEKKNKALDQWFLYSLPSYYVKVSNDYLDCERTNPRINK